VISLPALGLPLEISIHNLLEGAIRATGTIAILYAALLVTANATVRVMLAGSPNQITLVSMAITG
jgi:hypothetical protein